jgi:hypothetical protein
MPVILITLPQRRRGEFYVPSTSRTSIIAAPAFSSAFRLDNSADLEQTTHGLLPVPFRKFLRSLQFGDRRRCVSRTTGRGRWYLSSAEERGGRWRANPRRLQNVGCQEMWPSKISCTDCSVEGRHSEQSRSRPG